MTTFAGFSEDDLKRMQLSDAPANNGHAITPPIRKIEKLGGKLKKYTTPYKLPVYQKQESDDLIDNTAFDKCKLSLKTPSSSDSKETVEELKTDIVDEKLEEEIAEEDHASRKSSIVEAPDVVKSTNYSEDELTAHKVKLEELQLKQKLMEEQNKKRKEMLAKALADRTKQTAEEVMRLEKIKKELQILDGQFSQDVAVLRKKIDQACLTYSEAEKHYLKIEKEFLQAKINLQKEKEKKELLTEHLCALITHNETRKAQKLETLMLELASDKKEVTSTDDSPVIIDGVDEKTGKMMEIFPES